MGVHVDTQTKKGDALLLQAKPLLCSRLAGEKDFPSGAYDPLPGKALRAVQSPCYLSGGSGKACGIGNIAIGRNLASRHAPYAVQNAVEHRFLSHRGTRNV